VFENTPACSATVSVNFVYTFEHRVCFKLDGAINALAESARCDLLEWTCAMIKKLKPGLIASNALDYKAKE